MGIKKKIMLGFVVIGFILLLSSLIAVFELSRIRHSVSELMSENVKCINTTRLLLDEVDTQIFGLLNQLGRDTTIQMPVWGNTTFASLLQENRAAFGASNEKAATDSIMYAYAAYMQVMREAPQIWDQGYPQRRNWYFTRLHPVYLQLRQYIKSLTEIAQVSLEKNSVNVEAGFYRSIMPGIIAVAAGIVLVFLFNYFINIYFIDPLLKISKGITDYMQYKKTYAVKLENEDELKELNQSVKTILEEHKTLSSHHKS